VGWGAVLLGAGLPVYWLVQYRRAAAMAQADGPA
jgi:hypothetical protein